MVWIDDDEGAITSIIGALRNRDLRLTLTTMRPLSDSMEFIPIVVSPEPRETLHERVNTALELHQPYDVVMVDLSFDPENRTGAQERGRGLALHLKRTLTSPVGVYTKYSLRPRMRARIHSDGFDLAFDEIRQLYEDEDRLNGDDWYHIFANLAQKRQGLNGDGQTIMREPPRPTMPEPPPPPREATKPTAEPRKRASVFIGSSREALPLARALQEQLQYNAKAVVWNQVNQRLSVDFLTSFLENVQRFDFGVFIFAPDDILRIRDKTQRAVRDNVVFELGVFVGTLGRERTFIVAPAAADDIRALTDLVGMEPATYVEDYVTSDDDIPAGLGPASNRIIKAMDTLGPRDAKKASSK